MEIFALLAFIVLICFLKALRYNKTHTKTLINKCFESSMKPLQSFFSWLKFIDQSIVFYFSVDCLLIKQLISLLQSTPHYRYSKFNHYRCFIYILDNQQISILTLVDLYYHFQLTKNHLFILIEAWVDCLVTSTISIS